MSYAIGEARRAFELFKSGLGVSDVVRLKVKHIESAQKIIRVEQSKGGKDRNVMLSPETLDLLRQWSKARHLVYETPMTGEVWLGLSPSCSPLQPWTT